MPSETHQILNAGAFFDAPFFRPPGGIDRFAAKSAAGKRSVFAAFLVFALSASVRAATGEATTTFPVEAVVHRALTASFLENPRQIQRCLDALTSYDLVLESQGQARCGLSDNMAWLLAESLATPETRPAAYPLALERSADPLVEASLRAGLSQALPQRIRDTRRQDRWNRWADLMTVTGHNLARFANGQLIGTARFLVELIYSPGQFRKVTERERKEWWLIDTQLRLHPAGKEVERLSARMATLEARFRRDAIRKCLQLAHFYADRSWWHEAHFYVRAAEQADYRGQKRFRRQVRDAVASEKRWTAHSLTVVDTEQFLRTPEQVGAYVDLLKALALGNPERVRRNIEAASRVLADTPLADEVEDVHSVLFEWAGNRRKALEAQYYLALRFPEEGAGRFALVRLSDQRYNPRVRFDQELSRYRRRQAHYVFTGERTTRQNVELLSEIAAPPVPQVGALGVLLVTDALLRSLFVSFGNPVSPEDVLAAGEQLLADPRHGLTPDEETDVRITVGRLYQKLRRYDEAVKAYRSAHVLSPRLDKRLAERAADEQLRRILEMEDVRGKVLLFERLAATYPKTDAATRAREHLERLRIEARVDFEISYEWLAEDPVHWMKLGVHIPYEFMDGARGNGELNERGLVFWRDFPTSATYVCLDGKKGHVNLTPQRRAILRAAAEMWVDEKAALEESEIAQAGRRVPFEVRGSVGAEGLIVFPTLRQAPLAEEDKEMFR